MKNSTLPVTSNLFGGSLFSKMSLAAIFSFAPIFSSTAFAAISANTSAKLSVSDILKLPANQQDQIKVDIKSSMLFWQLALDENKEMNQRWRALVLAVKANPDAKMIHKAVTHKDWFIRNALLAAMEKYQVKNTVEVARALLQDKALVVRSAAVEVLASFKDASTRMALFSEMQSSRNYIRGQSLWIRPQIAKILSISPQKDEIKIFADMLHDSDPSVVTSAMSALEVYTGEKTKSGLGFSDRLAFWRKQASLIQ